MIETWPTDRDLWDDWYDIAKACLISDSRDLGPAHNFYIENREAMDAGAKLYWEGRVTAGYISALESAMAKYYTDPVTFAAEYQNQPLDLVNADVEMPPIDVLVSQMSAVPRLKIPDWATHVTAMIDVQGKLLYYGVKAWADQFTGAVVDYGTWPDQGRAYFSLQDARRTFFRERPGAGFEGCLHYAIHQLMDKLEGQAWVREDGTKMRLTAGLIDANYGQSTDVVYAAVGERKNSIWVPSHGRGVKATHQPLNATAPKKGEARGPGWYMPRLDKAQRPVRHVTYDTNWWKSFVAGRWAIAVPERGHQTFFADGRHRMYAEHLNAEYAVKVSTDRRECLEWFEKPNLDNHYLDIDVGCAVAASIAGVKMEELGPENKRKRKVKRVTAENLKNSDFFKKHSPITSSLNR